MSRTALVVTRATPDGPPEAEPVVVDVLEHVVRLELDDGDVIDLDRRELTAAMAAPA